ncbi:hypothetical protein PACILC2_12640 [Paenibacillus cisolokensis]|uniref:Conjugal transfer protein TraX n=1 Tax=Paenibacillus cisolokensis TaxID=1658519 RepID=A0ABQ4N3G7_9BACL|nr:TraX family protein [Paenibacillus cisolokensis]GIQ62696.1 hypothetical protein PACILC2_12640 [Paenibacillus cisolokensis]
MQFLAMLTMLVDHVGLIFYPDQPLFRIIGRLALPFYAYAIVLGYSRTRNAGRYALRLAVIAALSQFPYMLALNDGGINTVGTLLVCLGVLIAFDRFGLPAASAIAAVSAALLELLPFSYGFYALGLVLLYRYALHYAIGWHFALNIVYAFYKLWLLQMFSLLATFLIVYAPDWLKRLDRLAVPRLVWRSFYPAHLLVLGAVRLVLH